jgi:hypothetical protein
VQLRARHAHHSLLPFISHELLKVNFQRSLVLLGLGFEFSLFGRLDCADADETVAQCKLSDNLDSLIRVDIVFHLEHSN